MLQLVNLRFDLARHARVGVPHRNGDNPAKEIQVLVALHVPKVLHAGVVGDQRIRIISGDGREEILLVLFHDLVFSHGYSGEDKEIVRLGGALGAKKESSWFCGTGTLAGDRSCGAQAPSPAYYIDLIRASDVLDFPFFENVGNLVCPSSYGV